MFHKRWKLYVPQTLKGLIDRGVGDYDANFYKQNLVN